MFVVSKTLFGVSGKCMFMFSKNFLLSRKNPQPQHLTFMVHGCTRVSESVLGKCFCKVEKVFEMLCLVFGRRMFVFLKLDVHVWET